jgi:hypothetical protein
MGRTKNDERKTEPIKIRMPEDLLERVEQVQRDTEWRFAPRQDFLAMLIELGVTRYLERTRAADESEKRDTERRTGTA